MTSSFLFIHLIYYFYFTGKVLTDQLFLNIQISHEFISETEMTSSTTFERCEARFTGARFP